MPRLRSHREIESTHRRLVAGGVIEASTAVRGQGHRFGSQAVAIQGCTFRRDDQLFTVHDVHIRPGSKTEHTVYARNMSRALSHDEQKGPLEAVCDIFDRSEVLHRICAFDRDQLPGNMRVPVPPTATAGQPPPPRRNRRRQRRCGRRNNGRPSSHGRRNGHRGE